MNKLVILYLVSTTELSILSLWLILCLEMIYRTSYCFAFFIVNRMLHFCIVARRSSRVVDRNPINDHSHHSQE